jgi:prevent-host-death family protein
VQASIKNLKNNLSSYLGRVKEGEEIIITSHNHAIAKIIPLLNARNEVLADQAVFFEEIKSLHDKLRKVKLKKSMRDTVLARRKDERN